MIINTQKPLKVGIFYDGNFLLHASNYYNYIHHKRSRLSISGIHSFIKHKVGEYEGVDSRRCHIAGAHYYRGRINAVTASQRGSLLYNDRVFEDILMAEGVETHYLPLRNCLGKKEERGIDVLLSLEVYEMALMGKIDVAVLIISDTDYVPLLRKLIALGIRVMLLVWEFEYTNDDGLKVITKTSHELQQLANYPVMMHEEIEMGIMIDDPVTQGIFVESDLNSGLEIPATQKRETGEVLSIKNGFGFIKYPNNNLFFHYLDVLGDFSELQPGDMVEFTVEKNSNRQDIAKSVCMIQSDDDDDTEFDYYGDNSEDEDEDEGSLPE